MGKNLRQQESNVSIEGHNSNQGCIGGILHHLQGHKRLHVKKRLPYRKHGSTGKSSPVIAYAESSAESAPDAAEIHDYVMKNSAVETKVMESGSVHKSSMKSRIISMITDEMTKRKGRHRRTASCPVRTPLADTSSIHTSDPARPELPDSTHSNRSSVVHDPVRSVAVLKHSRSNASSVDYLRQNMGGLPVRDHTLLQDENMYAIVPSKYASLQESKLFWDALDLLNMRKELFLKILKDPNSSLAQNRRNSSKPKFGLTKSVSFPAIGSAERRASMLSASTSLEHFSGELEISENTSPRTASMIRKRRDNKAALKRFKNIREKIKHVIKDRKKEKHMILMDGVLHKIPYGRRASKDMKSDKTDKFGKFTRGNSFGCDEKNTMQNFKRASSFHDSFDKYDRLLETIITNKEESKDQNSDRMKFKTACNSPIHNPPNLKRILSLPDLSSHSYFQIDDSESVSVQNRQVYERKLSGGSENKMQLCSVSGSDSDLDSFTDVGDHFDDSPDSRTSGSDHEQDLNLELVRVTQSLKLDIIPENESIQHEDSNAECLGVSSTEDESSCTVQQDPVHIDSSIGSDTTADIDTLETRAKQFYSEHFHVHVDVMNQAEYNYVKGVLELSGFTRDELLGQWYSPDNPLDPLVFNEVEGCFADRPDSSGYEEGGSWYQLLMFDLINEVLLSLYERSFCYWPMPLTCQSHMHQMPKKNRVLEEVWADISWFLSWRPENDQGIDDAVSRDLWKGSGWMSLQYDAECVGLEIEDLIFDELLEEIIFE